MDEEVLERVGGFGFEEETEEEAPGCEAMEEVEALR